MITKVLFFIVQVKYHYKNLRCKINSFEFEIVKNFARIRKLTTWSLNRFSQISSCVWIRTSVLYFSNWFNLFFLKLICVIHVHIYEIGAFQLYLFSFCRHINWRRLRISTRRSKRRFLNWIDFYEDLKKYK